MATESSKSLLWVADALSEVGDRLREISNELRGLRPGTATQTSTIVPPTPEPPTRPATTPPPPQLPRFPESVAPPPAWTPAEPTMATGPTFWERVSREGAGSRILAWAGGVVTLAGVVLLLVLAIQNGYLGPRPRVLLGVVLGLALVGIGMWLHRNPNARTGAYALAATGIAVLYLDVLAATTLYGFLPPLAGLLAGLAVAGRWDSQLFAVFVVVSCAVSAPILTEGFVPLLLGSLLVLQIATTPVQLGRRWGGLSLAAGLPPLIATMIMISLATNERNALDAATIAVLSLVTSAVQVAFATLSATRRPADELPLGLLLIAPLPTMLAAILVPRLAAAALPAAIGVLLVAVWALHRTGALAVPDRFAMAAGGAGILALFQATATALDGNARAIALLGGSVLLTLISVRLRYPAALLGSALFGLGGLLLTLVVALPPRMFAVPPARTIPAGAVATAGLTGLLLAVAAIALGWAAVRLDRVRAPHAWGWGGIVALHGASGATLSIGLAISPDRSGFLLGHVLLTVSWTVGALVLLLRGVDSVPPRVAGLALVAAALTKLVLFDLSSLDGIARVAAFLVAGLVLLAAGARYARLVAARGRRTSG
ncbi:MAG TPA: DUF2339 domain-containing protein [Actinophytocola sp.]|uniref:DUF2339 domain-containing protein n=1 Tax=Actinophytocola sp. TaxID=1872138 RepID=UPI002DDCD496|nr:DUF2339 domain-containing protein [Actinophytocola sp.]HEV2780306.1 DUF2339 domain-containing protein [Actinophytocola sp.]